MNRTCKDCQKSLPLTSAHFPSSKGYYSSRCKPCYSARTCEARRKGDGLSVPSPLERLAPEFTRGSMWTFVDDQGRDVVMQVSSISLFNGLCIHGKVGKKQVRIRPKWLRENAKQVAP